MGIGLLIAASIGSTVVSTISASRNARKARNAEAESNAVRSANESYRNRLEKRRAIKEERIRRARIIQASEGSGVAGSSGQLGAVGALQTNTGQNIAQQSATILATNAVNRLNQTAADYRFKAKRAEAIGGAFKEAISLYGEYKGLM